MRAYFLGGNDLPWYMLGLSNASGMFDIAGTMWMVSAIYVYGLKSVWLPWLWPVFNQVFLAAYLSQWWGGGCCGVLGGVGCRWGVCWQAGELAIPATVPRVNDAFMFLLRVDIKDAISRTLHLRSICNIYDYYMIWYYIVIKGKYTSAII